MNRIHDKICPNETTLTEYIIGQFDSNEFREIIEEHLFDCSDCRELVIDAYKLTRPGRFRKLCEKMQILLKEHVWGALSITAIIFSFALKSYFWQFLVVGILAGLKWIIDSKTTRMLIMINEAWAGKNINKEKESVKKRY